MANISTNMTISTKHAHKQPPLTSNQWTLKKNMTYVNENSGLDLVQALKYGGIKQSLLFL